MFSSRNVIVLPFTFIFFQYSGRKVYFFQYGYSVYFFLYGTQCPLLKWLLSSLHWNITFVMNHVTVYVCVYFWMPYFTYLSNFVPAPYSFNFFIFIIGHGSCILLALFFIFKIAWAIPDHLHFHVHFRNSLSNFHDIAAKIAYCTHSLALFFSLSLFWRLSLLLTTPLCRWVLLTPFWSNPLLKLVRELPT